MLSNIQLKLSDYFFKDNVFNLSQKTQIKINIYK